MTELPPGWSMKTLGDVASWGSGGTPPARVSEYYEGDIPWAVIGDLNDGVVSTTRMSITDAGLRNSAAKWFPAGTVLVAMYGSIGKLGIAASSLTTNQAIAGAVPHAAILQPRFLFYYLMSQRADLAGAGKGAAQQNIGQGVLKAWPIPVPSLAEQQRIVKLLETHVSRLEEGCSSAAKSADRLLALRQSLRKSAVERLKGESVPLGELVATIEAGRSLGKSAPSATDSEWGIIKVSAMTWGEFRPEENKRIPADLADPRYEIRRGDLLVSRANTSAYVGASVVVGDVRPRLLLSDKSLRLVPKRWVNPRWLNEVLQSPSVRAQISALATGTKDSMRNISQRALLSVQVPKASAQEQVAMLEHLDRGARAVDRLRVEVERARHRAQQLHRALLSEAFSGRLTRLSREVDVEEEVLAG